jgi:hypothetical protein
MPALLATLHDLIIGGAGAAAILACCLIYAEARKERDEPTHVEVEETPSAWDSLPPKWNPTPAESHLRKTHLGRRG